MPKHRHKFKIANYSSQEIQFSCSCGERTARGVTKKELEILGFNNVLKSLKRKPKYGQDIHFVYHEYMKKFRSEKSKKYDTKYELMCAIEEWATKYPKDVKVVHIDDSYHAGSRLFLIDHRTKNKYFGITVVVVTQCDPQPAPFEFFLYPDHQANLLSTLSCLFAGAKIIESRQEKAEQRRSARIDKLIRP